MATQGLITIMRNDRVYAKIITGADGRIVVPLAQKLREYSTPTGPWLLAAARQEGLGGPSLVVQMGPDEFYGEDVEELPELYGQSFSSPGFNPRWRNGSAEYSEIVEI